MRRRLSRSVPRRGAAPRLRDKHQAGPRRSYQPPARPPQLVAQAVAEGALLVGRVLHKDLHKLVWQLTLPAGLRLAPGDFFTAQPHPTAHATLLVQHKIPAARAAVAAALANHGLPTEFSPADLQATADLPAYRFRAAEGREDWRALPFITIDGDDAKDFDDAVWAAAWPAGGHHVRVAIADVAHYVPQGSVLAALAFARGNSTYLPGTVVPMLPERLSNDLCSLNPHVDRPVLAAELWLSPAGVLQHYRFCRAVIHSARRCTYPEVEAHLHGHAALPEALHAPLRQLHAAFQALLQQRTARGAINLDLPELQLTLNAQGQVQQAVPRPRLVAHQLIEELMIAANVAAATALAQGCADTRPVALGGGPQRPRAGAGLYRIHLPPTQEKLATLKAVLSPLGFTAPPPQSRPAAWAALAQRVQRHAAAPTLQRALLQAQMQAQYSPENQGHFGLALPLYTHFTSPIRRASDLLVHYALLAIMGQENPLNAGKLEATCRQLNLCERRSQQAEWEARDRLLAGLLAHQVGQTFAATITSVAPFGCFVALDGLGAEALLPTWLLPDYAFVPSQAAFRRTRGGKGLLRAGTLLQVKLLEADFAAARLTVALAGDKRVDKRAASA